MQVHKIFYGPDPDKINLHTSVGIRTLVNDDTITDRYTLKGSLHRTIIDCQLHQTPDGLVLSLTKVQPCQSSDKRACTQNNTLFLSIKELAEELKPYLDFGYNGDSQLEPLQLMLKEG